MPCLPARMLARDLGFKVRAVAPVDTEDFDFAYYRMPCP